MKRLLLSVLVLSRLAFAGDEPGLAAKYPGDAGLERDPAVVFAENFQGESVPAIGERWTHVSNAGGAVMALADDVPPFSSGKHSLQITATRGKNTGGHLFKVLKPGYDELHVRFYVKFAADHGFVNHFVKLQGSVDPPREPEGEAGYKHTKSFSTGIEPQGASYLTYPEKPFAPPGIWHCYSYWPEMRSWQNPDGSGTSYYGNDFEPLEPAVAPRNRWQCVEFMVKMNSTPEKADGEQAFWIDGKLAARFAPGSVTGYWMRDVFRLDEAKGKPFEGFRWRTDPRINVNKVWLLYYVNPNEGTAKRNEEYAAKHSEAQINTQTGTVWFDDVVVATKYIGPITPK
jgi:hypothetical protein